MGANNKENNNMEPSHRIENNVLKGKVLARDSRYNNVGKLVFDTMKRNKDLTAQVDAITEAEETFGYFLEKGIKCALWLQKRGVRKGDIIVISTHNHGDSNVPYIAALFLGAIVNPWNNKLNVQLARHFITLTEPKVIFTNDEAAATILEAAKIERFKTEVVSFNNYPGTTPYSEVLKGHQKSAIDAFECKDNDNAQDTALILFSSGTTGLPKGVEISHYSLLNVLELDEGLHFADEMPLWFSTLDWISGAFLPLLAICSSNRRIDVAAFDEKLTCEIIEKFKVTWLMVSTSMANRFVRYTDLHKYDLSTLTHLLVGGAALNTESQDILMKRLPHTTVLQAFGMTELGGVVAVQFKGSTSGSCGVASMNCEIKIVDPVSGATLGPNQNGELCAKTPKMMTGYYKNPEETKKVIDKDGFLHSGDLAYYNEAGEIFIIDRIKELIKYQGHHVSPNDIENLLLSHPAVLEVAVVGVPHILDNEHPIAFVSKVPNKEVTAEELMELVAKNMMDSHKLRAGVKFLPNLPHTASGKIARNELKAMAKQLEVC